MRWLALFLAATASASAQLSLPEELALARSITMQEEGEVQATPYFQFFKLPDEKRTVTGADLEYGLSDRFELDAEVPYVFRNPNDARAVHGLGDLEAALRYAFVPLGTNGNFAFNAGLQTITPTGNAGKELGEGRVAVGPIFAASDWFKSVNVQLSGGWAHAVSNGGEEPRDDFEYNVAVLLPVREFFVGIEGNGESTHRQTKLYVTPEIVWRPRHSFEIQFAVPIGVTRAAGDYGIIASVSFEFAPRGRDND